MEITLSNDKGIAYIDDADAWLTKYSWHIHRAGNKDYARAWIDGRREYMHRLLLPDAALIDHIDGDGLNNRRSNLRDADKSINSINTGLRRDNTTGVKGVSYHKASGKYVAEICRQGTRQYLGLYATVDLASQAIRTYLGSLDVEADTGP